MEKYNQINYNITITNENFIRIPYDTQASYHVSYKNVEKMNFIFYNFNRAPNSNITFWVKGKSISNITLKNSNVNLTEYKYEILYFMVFFLLMILIY